MADLKQDVLFSSVIIRYLSRSGRVYWIADILPLRWTINKTQAANFQTYNKALQYINEVGLDFSSIEEIEA